MSVKKFDELFPLKNPEEEERRHFVNRINTQLFSYLRSLPNQSYYHNLFYKTSVFLEENNLSYFTPASPPNFADITGDDFIKTLRVVTAIYEAESPEFMEETSKIINGCSETFRP
jgi:hypothetical protein